MLLKSLDDFELEITIVGYEFPDILHSCWDSNWLNVLLRVVAPNETGKSIGPIMTTWEAAAFAQWLGAHASHQSSRATGFPLPSDDFIFTEPNLYFSAISSDRDTVTLNAHFLLEQPASWSAQSESQTERVWGDRMQLKLTRESLRAAASQLREELRKYPKRA